MVVKLRTELKENDKYIQFIEDTYDLNVEKAVNLEIPLIDKEELNSIKWNIGLICGSSGSGKSTVLSHQFKTPIEPIYNEEKPVISQFPTLEPEEVCDILESVGLSSVPMWLRKPHELSMGEKARLDLCYALVNTPKGELIVIDEFTSTINREVAKSLSFALQRYVRKNNLQIVISSCHFDILEYLQPDWIFNLNKKNGGIVELEYVKYADSEYNNYNNINPNSVLSDVYNL